MPSLDSTKSVRDFRRREFICFRKYSFLAYVLFTHLLDNVLSWIYLLWYKYGAIR